MVNLHNLRVSKPVLDTRIDSVRKTNVLATAVNLMDKLSTDGVTDIEAPLDCAILVAKHRGAYTVYRCQRYTDIQENLTVVNN